MALLREFFRNMSRKFWYPETRMLFLIKNDTKKAMTK